MREEIYEEHVDWLLLDTNGLMHPSCFKVLEKMDITGLTLPEVEEMMIEEILSYLEKIINLVNPHCGVYIAIDGVAPMAKMKQQRSRRFKSAADKVIFDNLKRKHGIPLESCPWSNSCISPGTKFMEHIHERILQWAATYNDNFPSDWPAEEKRPHRQIIYNSYHTPMEGEHKLIQFIRDNNAAASQNLNYVIYGLDADLIFLAIALGNENIHLLREEAQLKINGEQKMDVGEFCFVSIDALKEFVSCIFDDIYSQQVNKELKAESYRVRASNAEAESAGAGGEQGWQDVATKQAEPEKHTIPAAARKNMLDDFVLICFLLGNDFLPHLPALNIYTSGLNIIISSYVALISKYEFVSFLIAPAEPVTIINNDLLTELLLGLGEAENQILHQAAYQKKKKWHCPFKSNYEIEKFNMETLNFKIVDPVNIGKGKPEEWRERYYSYYGIMKPASDADRARYVAEIDNVCMQYLRGVKFVALYYFQECPSWDWIYPFDHPPFLADIQSFLSRGGFTFNDVTFERSAPMKPLMQLLTILPPMSSFLVPVPLRQMMINPLSQLGGMYPVEFPQDLLNKDKFWQCIPILPRMNLPLMRAAYEANEKLVVEAKHLQRNERLEQFVFNVW